MFFKLDIPVERRRQTDPDLYVIWVLWLLGHSQRSIAFVMGMRKSQIGGIIGKSDYKNRSAMTDQERRKLLQELQDIRMDDGFPIDQGKLNRISWEIQPLSDGRQRRPARKAVAP